MAAGDTPAKQAASPKQNTILAIIPKPLLPLWPVPVESTAGLKPHPAAKPEKAPCPDASPPASQANPPFGARYVVIGWDASLVNVPKFGAAPPMLAFPAVDTRLL
jgi:hypothetical protein